MGGKAEKGSTKWLANNMKSKGLQRLRWFCQVCERQMRDENGFKQHCLSEAHNRNMQVVGENSRKFISQYSDDFKRDFLRLLRTAHGEKKVHANNFYQEYISDKQHVHMNATRWPSLTEFVKYLGREGICRVEEGERGLEIAWIDDSPEALRRREAVAKRDRMERGEEERQARLLEEQIKRANELKKDQSAEEAPKADTLKDKQGDQPIKFSFGGPVKPVVIPANNESKIPDSAESGEQAPSAEAAKPMSFSLGAAVKAKPVNVFSSKHNPLKQKKAVMMEPPKKVTELDRVLLEDKAEQERKRQRALERESGQGKRVRLS